MKIPTPPKNISILHTVAHFAAHYQKRVREGETMTLSFRYETPKGTATIAKSRPVGPWHVTLPDGSAFDVDDCGREKVIAIVDKLIPPKPTARPDAKHRRQPGLF